MFSNPLPVSPTMELWVNGNKINTWTNVAASWTTYTQSANLSGKDVIEVVFTNDCSASGYDRNLFIDYVLVDGVTIQAEGGAAVVDRGAGNSAFDGLDTITGQEGLYWNAALRLVKGVGAYAAGYDQNGNMTSRVVDGVGQILSYDAENRLIQVQTSITTSTFAYDGEGNRVKGTIGGVTTTYIGNHFEWTGSTSTMVKYYYAASQRVAMMAGSTVYYLLTDHLGSTALTVTSAGVTYGEKRYKPWGEERYTSGTTPTAFRFTGQRLDSYINLYWYGSRWYDDSLGRFIQPDSIIPD